MDSPAEAAPPPESPREPPPEPARGSRLGVLVCWAVIAVAVALQLALAWIAPAAVEQAAYDPDLDAPGLTETADPQPPPALLQGDLNFRLMARYHVGVHALLRRVPDMPPSSLPGLGQVEELARSPVDRLRLAAVAGELHGAHAALARLDALEEQGLLPPPLHLDARTLRSIYRSGPDAVEETRQRHLVARHGWFGRLALSHGLPPTDPRRDAALAPAVRTVVGVLAMLVALGTLGIASLVLFIIAVVKWRGGEIRTRYPALAPGSPESPREPHVRRGAFLEAFALYLAGFIVFMVAMRAVAEDPPMEAILLFALALPLVVLWPRLRGVSWREWREGMGWHRGRGVLREVAAGALGYIAGLPLVAAGVMVSLVLMFSAFVIEVALEGPPDAAPVAVERSEGDAAPEAVERLVAPRPPVHPIVHELDTHKGLPGVLTLYLIACVWAPVVEELMFRGALYHHVRGRFGAIGAGLLVGFIFAAVHPQGLLAVPALMGIAMVFALLREWRGSVIAPIAAHAMSNGAVVTLLVTVLG